MYVSKVMGTVHIIGRDTEASPPDVLEGGVNGQPIPWNTRRTASNFLFSMETRDQAGRAWSGSSIVRLAREVARLGVAFSTPSAGGQGGARGGPRLPCAGNQMTLGPSSKYVVAAPGTSFRRCTGRLDGIAGNCQDPGLRRL